MNIPFIAWHPIFKHPLPEKHRFPMLKYELIHDRLLHEGVADEQNFFAPSALDKKYLTAVHAPQYVDRLFELELNDDEIRRSGFPMSKQLVERELHIAQGTIAVAEAALDLGIGFNTAGGTHHAGSNWAEGFCLLNDQAIAAQYLLDHHSNINQILIIDLDVHQGNGTAEIFEDEERVFTFSMHGERNFPFKKEISDLDVGLPDGTEGDEYLTVLKSHINALFTEVQPDFVFYQAGADILETDKMGRLKLNWMDCRDRDRLIFEACRKYKVPVQVSMGGGYSKDIKEIVRVHSQTFKEGIDCIIY